ncbi:MAG: peptide deformylase [Verrucomicrobia bacterium]|nr:peptide deformylase [Verrucomicrobiota bacterium]
MLLKVVLYGDPVLRTKASPIAEITPEIQKLAQDMIETMIAVNGVGLAGPQVGRSLRIFVIQEEIMGPNGEFSFKPPEVIINPVLSKPSSETQTGPEGCLSIPGIHVEVERPLRIHVRYQNLKGEFLEEDLDHFRARMFMHENDHLNGTLMIDRIPPNYRNKVDPFLRKIKSKVS